jgi:hypothetical protein
VTKRPRPTPHPGSRSGKARDGGLDPGKFPELLAFLGGYLHEGFLEEHGSAREAAAAFCKDATPTERRALAGEIDALIENAGGLPIHSLRHFVTHELRSRWEPHSLQDLADLVQVIRAAL